MKKASLPQIIRKVVSCYDHVHDHIMIMSMIISFEECNLGNFGTILFVLPLQVYVLGCLPIRVSGVVFPWTLVSGLVDNDLSLGRVSVSRAC